MHFAGHEIVVFIQKKDKQKRTKDKQVNQTVFVRLRNKIAPNQCRLAFVKKLHW